MKCLITNCNHSKSNRMKHRNDTCWDEWQICPCCTIILTEFGIITYRKFFNHVRCTNSIARELYVKPVPDQKLLVKIQQKKKFPKKMSFEGVAM